MNQVIIVGCDLHDRSLLLKAACGMEAPHQKSFLNDCQGRQAMLDFLLDFAQQHKADRIVFVYEASGQGYGLYDLLTDQGVECYVLSPSHLPKSAKQKRNKTDAKDAQMLLETARAYVMAGNELPMVWIPPKALRNDRELVRARLETAEAGASVKLKILSLLKRHSRAIPEVYRNNPNWTKRFLRYLATESQQLPSVVGPVLLSLLARLEVIRQQVTELDRQLRKLSTTERYRVPCEALLKMNGVGLLTALTFLTEMGDLNRFPNRRTIGAYLGLTPAAKESGEASDRKGHITRQGGSRLRKMLCQAAWAAIRRDAAVRTAWERIRGSRPGRGKKAIVAIMRRLGIRMWHVALAAGVSGDLATRPIPPPCWLATSSTHLNQAT
jgi:transposase